MNEEVGFCFTVSSVIGFERLFPSTFLATMGMHIRVDQLFFRLSEYDFQRSNKILEMAMMPRQNKLPK